MPSHRKSAALCVFLLAAHLIVCPQSATAQPTSSSLSGTVIDKAGATVTSAHITIKLLDKPDRETTSDASGRFSFPDLPPGPYTISVAADGLVTVHTAGTIHPATAEQLPQIVLPVPDVDTAVEVTATTHDLAEAEIKVQEHQRLFGAIPNFYVSYDWNAAPLSSGQKFQLGWKTVLDPINLVITAGFAGVEQATNSYPGWSQSTSGYFKRFGAANGDNLVGTFLGGYLFPVIFHQDPRYFYMGKGTILHRTLYALSTAVIARGDNGKWQPGYAAILGDFGAGAVSNLYYPANSRQGASLTIENGFLSLAADGVGNVIQEFLLRHLTRNPPTYTPPNP